MSENHSPQEQEHAHRFESSSWRLSLAFWTQLIFFVVELVGGILTNSLALLADAGHMFSDVVALGLSFLALRWTLKPPTSQKTYGYHRMEILVALLNGVALWVMSAYIFYEAYGRISQPPEINTVPMLIIATLGLLINLFGVFILYPTREHGLNLRSAFIHLAADSLGSLAAMAAFPAFLGLYGLGTAPRFVFGIAIAALVTFRHKDNLRRLIRKEEHRL